jgi:hypothetical protein
MSIAGIYHFSKYVVDLVSFPYVHGSWRRGDLVDGGLSS